MSSTLIVFMARNDRCCSAWTCTKHRVEYTAITIRVESIILAAARLYSSSGSSAIPLLPLKELQKQDNFQCNREVLPQAPAGIGSPSLIGFISAQ